MGHIRHLKLVICPGCHHIMKVPLSIIGKTFHCSKCDKALKMMSKAEKNRISIQSQVENHVQVQMKNLPERIIFPEKREKIVKFVKRILKRIKNVLWRSTNKDI